MRPKYCDEGGTIRAVLEPHGKQGLPGPLCPMITRTVPRWTIPISLNGSTGGMKATTARRPGTGSAFPWRKEATRLLGGKIQVDYKDGVITFGVTF